MRALDAKYIAYVEATTGLSGDYGRLYRGLIPPREESGATLSFPSRSFTPLAYASSGEAFGARHIAERVYRLTMYHTSAADLTGDMDLMMDRFDRLRVLTNRSDFTFTGGTLIGVRRVLTRSPAISELFSADNKIVYFGVLDYRLMVDKAFAVN